MNAATAKLDLLAAAVLRPAMWDATAEAWSRLIPHDWPGDHAEELREMVVSGAAEMVEVHTAAGHVGFVVYQVDDSFPQPELIVVSAYGADTEHDLTSEVLPQLEKIARSAGCASIRFHTMRAGLIRKAMAEGWRVSEVLMRKDVR